MITLLFNANDPWFEISIDIELGIPIRDGDLFAVQCLCHSWLVNDIRHQWGVDDFPNQPALRIAHFLMEPATNADLDDEYLLTQNKYRVLLHPLDSQSAPIPVLFDASDKQFFGVATTTEAASKVAKAEGKSVWLTVVANLQSGKPPYTHWGNIMINRQTSHDWARADVLFERPSFA